MLHDTNVRNLHPTFMQDVIGGMVPNIVLRSPISAENRIYIEVNDAEPLG